MHTTVGIIGAGPAGLLLARLLYLEGVEAVVLESRDRAYCEQRQRAGILEQGTVDVLREAGVAGRLDREGLRHEGIELRFDGRGHRIDFPSLTGGRAVTVYAQTEVVKDLIAQLLADEAPLLFEAEALEVQDAESAQPRIRYRHGGEEHELHCDYVVACDGSWGIGKAAFPAGTARVVERSYPYAWLGILAETAPSSEELVYTRHERGFALLSMRTPHVSRLYLQVPAGAEAEEWSDEEIWDELDRRTLLPGGDPLERGRVTSKSVTAMRSSVHAPMRHGNLFLAGDAAHIVPPTGAKGLNLAVSDVVTFARAHAHLRRTGSAEHLDAYSQLCLQRIWQAERFSYAMTTTLHRDPAQTEFDDHLQLARLDRVATSRTAAAELAENYTGLPLPLG